MKYYLYLSPIIRVLSGFMSEWIAVIASKMYFSGFPRIVGSLPAAVFTAAINAPVPKSTIGNTTGVLNILYYLIL